MATPSGKDDSDPRQEKEPYERNPVQHWADPVQAVIQAALQLNGGSTALPPATRKPNPALDQPLGLSGLLASAAGIDAADEDDAGGAHEKQDADSSASSGDEASLGDGVGAEGDEDNDDDDDEQLSRPKAIQPPPPKTWPTFLISLTFFFLFRIFILLVLTALVPFRDSQTAQTGIESYVSGTQSRKTNPESQEISAQETSQANDYTRARRTFCHSAGQGPGREHERRHPIRKDGFWAGTSNPPRNGRNTAGLAIINPCFRHR